MWQKEAAEALFCRKVSVVAFLPSLASNYLNSPLVVHFSFFVPEEERPQKYYFKASHRTRQYLLFDFFFSLLSNIQCKKLVWKGRSCGNGLRAFSVGLSLGSGQGWLSEEQALPSTLRRGCASSWEWHTQITEELVNSMARLYWKRIYKKSSRKFGIKLQKFVNKPCSAHCGPTDRSFPSSLSPATLYGILQLHSALPIPPRRGRGTWLHVLHFAQSKDSPYT